MERNNCVDAETLAAWTAGTLSSREADAVEAHLADCASCQAVLAVFARTEPPPAVSESLWRRWHLRWAVPIAAAATAVAIWVAVPDDERTAQIQDAFVTSESQSAPPAANQSAAANPPAAPLEKREPPAAAEVDSRLEARADLQARSAAPTSERELDAVRQAAPAAPAAAQPTQEQLRPLADSQSGVLRQRQEAIAPVEIVSPDPTVRWRILPTGQLERSADAGTTWGSVTLPMKVQVTALRALSATSAVVTAADGRQFRTEDQGKTWTQVAP